MGFQFPEQRIPSSVNPAPNVYPALLVKRETVDIPASMPYDQQDKVRRRIARGVLDNFWLDVGFCHNSASMQQNAGHPLHEYYDGRAKKNRERIAKDREKELSGLRSSKKV